MSHRGRNYYDPILQVPSNVEGQEDKSRIEVFPVGMDSPSRLASEVGKWASRRVDVFGAVVEQGPAAGEQNEAIRQAQEKWPGLEIYFLQAEIEDSTWEGVGPSPRLWQQPRMEIGEVAERPADFTPAVDLPTFEVPEPPQQPSVVAVEIQTPGIYVRVDDITNLLESYAQQFDGENNPSAALGLREAARALKEAF